MKLLALDVGSSSVKAEVLVDGSVVAGPVRVTYPTTLRGVRVEIDPPEVLGAVGEAARQLADQADGVDLIGLAVLCPAFVAMDAAGEPLTPLVTHADRRSVDVAHELERRVGQERWLGVAGNRPFPGSIAATTWAWFLREEPDRMRGADLVGQLSTYLHRQLTGERVIDPSNASYLGVYDTVGLSGWSGELLDAVGGTRAQLPRVVPAADVAGRLTAGGARHLGLPEGTPMIAGCVDGSAAMYAAGARTGGLRAGQLVNVSGTTDVLALLTDRAVAHPKLLTRALGTGRWWVSVATIASAGTTLSWVRDTLYAGCGQDEFRAVVGRVARQPDPGTVRFEPYLAGERATMGQKQGGFAGLTLATSREQMLSAVLEALAAVSAARLPVLREVCDPLPTVFVTGGFGDALGDVLHRDWPSPPGGGSWDFRELTEATSGGLAALVAHGG